MRSGGKGVWQNSSPRAVFLPPRTPSMHSSPSSPEAPASWGSAGAGLLPGHNLPARLCGQKARLESLLPTEVTQTAVHCVTRPGNHHWVRVKAVV